MDEKGKKGGRERRKRDWPFTREEVAWLTCVFLFSVVFGAVLTLALKAL